MVDLLLEKFDNVQVDASARISPEDADYCDGEHLAYERAHKLYSGFRNALADTIVFEKEEWAARTGNEVTDYRSSKYCETGNEGGLDQIDTRIEKIQIEFIDALKSYFTQKYDIKLEVSIREKLEFNKPRYESSMPEEKWDTLQEEYRVKCSRLLHYNEVVDEILLQLDGLSFNDKVAQQIKDDAKKKARDYYESKRYFTVDKKVIRFESFTGLYENHNSILRALWHFNTGLTSIAGTYWSNRFFFSFQSERDRMIGTHELGDNRKVCKFRYFKSGRWDITFGSEELADAFARDYLGY